MGYIAVGVNILSWVAIYLRENGSTMRKVALGHRFGQEKRFTLVNGMKIKWRATDF